MNFTAEKQGEFLAAYEEYADAIFRHCFFRIYNREEATDLVQETFIKTWEYLDKGNEVHNLRAFLYRVANNLIIDRSRKKRPSSLDELQDQGFDPANDDHVAMGKQLEAREVLALISELDEKYRNVILMRFVDDMSPKEIAEILNQSENSVSVRLHRGLKKARELAEKKCMLTNHDEETPHN